jgi:hypothetical protein
MGQAFVSQSPDELRRQAAKMYAIASHVARQDVASHLNEHAAALLAEAELRFVGFIERAATSGCIELARVSADFSSAIGPGAASQGRR